MSEEVDAAVVCALVSEGPPRVPSETRQCEHCDQELHASKAILAELDGQKIQFVCLPCAVERHGNVKPTVTEATRAQVEEQFDGDDMDELLTKTIGELGELDQFMKKTMKTWASKTKKEQR